MFAGKLDYQRYRFMDRNIIRFIMLVTGGPTDLPPSRISPIGRKWRRLPNASMIFNHRC